MKFSLRAGKPTAIKTDCIVLPVDAAGKLSTSGESIDKASDGALSKLIARRELGEANGSTLLLQELNGCKATRTLLVRLGENKKNTASLYIAAFYNAAPTIARPLHQDVQSYMSEAPVTDMSVDERIEAEVQILRDHAYSFDGYKSKSAKSAGPKSYRIGADNTAGNKKALVDAVALADGIDLFRHLGNTPPNVCNPQWLESNAKKIASAHAKLKLTVLNEKQMHKLGMGALLGVSRGSAQPPRMIIFEYKGGAAKEKPLALVGKGVTFDSGGINIKPSNGLDEMKYDMCGAATVFGAIEAAAKMNLRCNIVGVVAAAENMPR